jgi:transposase-like protein
MLCPKCKDRAHRAHRVGLTEHLASIAGFLPYKCHDCNNRFLRFRDSSPEARVSANPRVEREIAATRTAHGRKRRQREVLLYGLALLLFAAILYFLTRAPSAGA